MADGEVEVSVRAEGVEDAAGEMDGALAEGGGGGAAAGGENAAAVAGNTGKMVGLLGSIAALLTFAEDILNVLGIVSGILRAFVAPVAIMLLRLLQPVLALMVELLPIWLEWMGQSEGFWSMVIRALTFVPVVIAAAIAMWVGRLIDAAGEKLDALADTAEDWLGRLLSTLVRTPVRIWNYVRQLPGMIARKLRDVLPSLPGGVGGGGGPGAPDWLRDLFDGGGGGGGAGDGAIGTAIQIGGGLVPFVDQITKNGSVDFP